MDIAVIGTGYVGLVTGTCFADVGHRVTCVDIDPKKVEILNSGQIPIYEPGLQEVVSRNAAVGRLRFTTEYEDAIPGADACFIAVGTPQDNDGTADTTAVLAAAEMIAATMDGFLVVIGKSTVPVGTARRVRDAILAKTSHSCEVVSNPEFLKEGTALHDFTRPDRVVVGIDERSDGNKQARSLMESLYLPFVPDAARIVFMNLESAELTKYAANTMLATRISLVNELANVCDLVGGNIKDVSRGIGLDPRIGPQFLYAGIGYGGSCFPKDVRAVVRIAEDAGYQFEIAKAVDVVNERQKTRLAELVIAHHDNDVSGKTFAVWGLAFKPDTDDIREAPSLTIIRRLVEAGAHVRVFDPEAMDTFKYAITGTEQRSGWDRNLVERVEFASNRTQALINADALLLLTEWRTFRNPGWEEVHSLLKKPVVFDGRNIYAKSQLPDLGFSYFGIGLGATTAKTSKQEGEENLLSPHTGDMTT